MDGAYARVDLYVDGTSNQSVLYGSAPIQTIGTDPVTIGKIIRSTWPAPRPDGYFHGAIDDIRFYNRALSGAEILALYNENGWPVDPPPPPSISLNVAPTTPTAYCPDQPTTVRYNLSGQYDSIRVEPQAGVLFRSDNEVHLQPEATTTYRITAFAFGDDPPCTDTLSLIDSVTVTVFDPPIIENTPVYDCIGKVREIGMDVRGGEGPYSWQWQPETGLSDPQAQWPTVEVTSDINYRVIVTDARGCRDTANVSLTALESPVVDILRVDAEDTLAVNDTLYLCDPEAGIQLIAKPGLEEILLSYTWIEGEGLDRTDTSHVIARPSDTTTYVVALVRAGCYAYDTIVVIPTSPPVIDAGEDAVICSGENYELGTVTNNPRVVYSWSPSATLDDATLSQPTATPTASTTYYVFATDTVTDCSVVDSVTITVTDVRLSLVDLSMDFGTLDGCESTLTESITVRNTGADPAELLSGSSRDGVVQLVGGRRSIPAGEEVAVELRFTPPTAGNYAGDIVLYFGPCGDSLVLPYAGDRATSNVSLTPGSLDFGRAADCEVEPLQQEITVTNSSTDDATIRPLSITAPYSVISPTLPVTIPEGESTTLTIGYAPTGAGSFARTMHIPFQTGACSDSIPVELGGEVWEPMLTTEDAPLDFGLLDGCTADTTLSIELTNPGSDLLSISQVELPGGVTRQGSVDEVPAGGAATLQLRYAPSGTGTLSGEALVIYGPCPDTLRVSLVGEKRGVSFAIADTLDFGELCLGEGATLPLEVLLNSQGTGNGAVVEAVLAGGGFGMDQMDWMDIMDGDGAELRDGVARTLGVTFTPDAEGPVSGTLRLRLEPCGVERTVVLQGSATRVQLNTPGLDFGTLPNGTTTTGTLRYTNTGSSPLRIDQLDESAMNGSPFTVLSTTPALPVELGAGQSVDIEVEYVVAAGASTATLGAIVVGACGTTVVATISGVGESSGFARLKLPQLAGEPGELLQLTMEVADASGVPTEGIGFRAEVSVEPSILSVANATPWRIANNGQRVIEVEGVIRPNESVAASIPVTALLGRVESSPLALFSIELTDPTQQLALEVEDGSLEILGLCREGGVRLFDPSGEIAIKSIAPSPTQNQMTITYSLSETGQHRMVLVDAGGREVLELFSGMFLPGTFELVRDVTSLPSGAYRLVLETPTLRVSEGVVIGR